jgi:hypothetical protein
MEAAAAGNYDGKTPPIALAESISTMLAFDIDHLDDNLDLERRRQLRTFLMECRSLVAPTHVGLPYTTRRRVPGLRRGEVAEIIGVTVDWYRAFESGRPVRVSPQFVSRLAQALRLTSNQELTLFRLAFVEMYRL